MIRRLEMWLEKIFSPLPSFSAKWQERLARHAWWIALTVAILMTALLILVSVLVFFFLKYAFINAFASTPSLGKSLYLGLLLFNVLTYVAIIVLLFMSVKPLHRLQQKGWTRLFRATILNGFTQVLVPFVVNVTLVMVHIYARNGRETTTDTISFGTGGLIIIFFIYILFQIRSQFTAKK